MKKMISSCVLVVSFLLFAWLRYYGELPSYNYHVAYVVEYLFYWSIALFVLSLFASVLSDVKYKIWFFIAIPFLFVSILGAYNTDGHDILFSGQYVILWSIILYSFISIIYFTVQFLKKNK